jgi:hypothetical protein
MEADADACPHTPYVPFEVTEDRKHDGYGHDASCGGGGVGGVCQRRPVIAAAIALVAALVLAVGLGVWLAGGGGGSGGSSGPSPAPAPTEVCNGISSSLTAGDCAAWQGVMHFATPQMLQVCPTAQTDPCSCKGGPNDPTVIIDCIDGRIVEVIVYGHSLNVSFVVPTPLLDLTAMTSLTLRATTTQHQFATLPPSINRLSRLTSLVFQETGLQGTLPVTLGQLTLLKRLDLGSNNFIGSVPPSLAQLRLLQYFSIAGSTHLSGTLPPFDFSQFTVCCDLNGDNNFTCPLPVGASSCNPSAGTDCWNSEGVPPGCV